MGSSYLSKPLTEKLSIEEVSERLLCGASSMQGWRLTQEDAHNCILDYDKDTSFFAVYDGHGGHEVALYCSQYLPDFLKNLELYKKGEMEKALEEAFLGFDATIASPEVVTVLKEMAVDRESQDESDDDEENVDNLYEEATMPIEQVIRKYTNNLLTARTTKEEAKPGSPFLKAKGKKGVDQEEEQASSCSSAGASSTKKKETEDVDESVSSSSAAGTEIIEKVEAEDNDENGHNGDNSPKSNVVSSTDVPNENGTPPKKDFNTVQESDGSEDDDDDDEDKTFEGPSDELSDDDDDDADAAAVDPTTSSSDDDDDEDDEDSDDDDAAADEFARNMVAGPGSDSGCTAVVALLKGDTLYVANAGDSRCIVCRDGKAVEMSADHKPEDDKERERIVKAGGCVTSDGRVNGGLNLSRALGDHAYKQNEELGDREQMITGLPDVKTLLIDRVADEFMVLACDGIWNFMSSQEVVDFVRPAIQNGTKLAQICEEMFDHCLAPHTKGDGTGCDNMTAIIVQFKQGEANLKRPASPAPEEPDNSKRSKADDNHPTTTTTTTST